MRKALSLGIGLMVTAGVQGPVMANEVATTDAAYRLAEIVVTAKQESITEDAGTVYRITQEQIKDQNAKTLDEALQLVPGLVIREGAEGTPRVDIRGFRTRHIQLFLNGIPIRNSYDGQFDPTRIPANIIAEIKVTSGGGSVLYGPGGNGGAIDIITRSAEESVDGTLAVEAAEGNSYHVKGSVAAAGEKVNFFGSVDLQDRDSFLLSDDFEATKTEDGDERENSDRKRMGFFSNLSYSATDTTTLGLTVSHVTGENGKPPSTNYSKRDQFSKKAKYERIDDMDNTLVQLGFEHESNSTFDYRGWIYYNQTNQEENGYDNDNYSSQKKQGSFQQETDTSIFGLSGQARYNIGDAAAATLGMTAETEEWESEGFENKKDGKVSNLADERDLQTYSMALEYERQMNDLAMVVGYGHHFSEREDSDDNDFSYLLGVSYDLSENTKLRLNHSRKIRFPSIKQLYGKDGNEDLETEVSYNYEGGVAQKMPLGGLLRVTAFYIDAENFIEKIDVGRGKEENRNFQEISIGGVETDFTIYPVKELMARIGVTWMTSEDKSEGSARDELQYRPEWKLSAETRYTFGFGLSIYGSVVHIANQYFYDSTQTMKSELDDFTVVNLKLSYELETANLELYTGVDNIFDENYEESYGLPQPGRTIYGGIEYHF